MRLIRSLFSIAWVGVIAVEAPAQTTGRGVLTGRVVDTTGAPIAGAEVALPDLLRKTLSGANGAFRFDSVPPGGWVARVRKIGFKQEVRTVDSDSSGIVFRLVPTPQALAPVVTVASQLGLSGFVKDQSGKPIPGARVRVLGVGLQTTTDSSGAFWVPAPAGSHMVSAGKASFAEKLAGVTIPKDSGRNVTIWLRPAATIPVREAHKIDDLRERLAWSMRTSQTLFTRERLENEGIEWIYDAVQLVWRRAGHVTDTNRECVALIDGGEATAPIIGLTTDDVESVEIYRTYPNQMATVAAAAPRSRAGRGGQFVEADAARIAKKQNGGKTCLAVYVWLR
jgi:hypothetical protein